MPEIKSLFPARAVAALLVLCVASLACNIQFGGATPAPAQTPVSSILWIAPENNSVIAEGASIEIAASASDSLKGIAKITFLVDGKAIAEADAPLIDGQATFVAKAVWVAQGIQGHLLTAEAARADGTVVGEAGVTVQVVARTDADSTVIAALLPVGSTPLATPFSTSETPSPAASLEPSATPPVVIAAPTEITPEAVPSATFAAVASAGSPTPEPTFIAPTLRVLSEFLNVRAGPGTDFEAVGQLNQGDTAKVVGRNAERSWVVVEYGSMRGWVTTSPTVVEVIGDTTNIPLVAANVPNPTPTLLNASQPGLAPTSPPGNVPDLVIEQYQIVPQSPTANQTFFVVIAIRNQGAVDAPSSLLSGVFQPGNEVSEMAVPPIPAGALLTLPPMYVTLRSGGANQEAVLTLDSRSEIDEGPIGEQNNRRTVTYNVGN